MRVIGALLLVGGVLAILRATVVFIAVATAAVILWGAIVRPTETYRFLALCLLLWLFQAYSLPCLAVVSIVLLADVALRCSDRKPSADDADRSGSPASPPLPSRLLSTPADGTPEA